MSALRYSEAGLAARDIFFGSVASVHFFVEDERLENLYEIILSRIFPRLHDFKVFPLSGKQSVLQHVRAGHAKSPKVTRLYLLDLDFDDLLGELEEREEVFYLDHYCIENVVLDETALVRVAIEERPRIRRAEVKRLLNHGAVVEDWLPMLDRLHRAFALAQIYALGIPNTDLPPESFTLSADRSTLCGTKISHYVNRVCLALIERGVIAHEEQYGELSRRVFGSARMSLSRVNGKFLSRLHYHKMKRDGLSGNVQQDSFVLRCAQGGELKALRRFSARVRAFLRQEGAL